MYFTRKTVQQGYNVECLYLHLWQKLCESW